jgi:hypothetical protein
MYADERLNVLAQVARKRYGGRCTPFRLGVVVGHVGLELPAPYAPGSHAERVYRDGMTCGREWRAKELQPDPGEGIGHE